MINLIQYFSNHVREDMYYYHHFFYLTNEERHDVNYYDDLEIIEEFRIMIDPKNENNITLHLNEKFILMCFYLYNNGYTIKQFPNFLERPNKKCALYDFLYNNMHKQISATKNIEVDKIKERDKRNLISELIFEKNKYDINNNIDDIFKKISTRNASFNQMTDDEKLKEICNAIEYLLKKDDKFKKLDYGDCFEILDDLEIKKIRNKLECFRHSSNEAIMERKNINTFQKDLLIRYGIFIIETISKKIN